MRRWLPSLAFLTVSLLAAFVLIPVLGFVLLVIVGLLVVAVVAVLAAPLLLKLPWFRNRPHTNPQQEDVMDAQFRELPDDEDEK